MDPYYLLVFVHVLLFVYWLGADLGVFVLARGAMNSAYSFEQRAVMLKFANYIDLTPRLSFALIFPVGLHMSQYNGLVDAPNWVFGVLWAIAIAWSLATIAMFRLEGKPAAATIAKALFIWQSIMFIVATWLGLYSMATGSPFDSQWLSLKIVIYGLIFGAGIGIDRSFQPLVPAFGRLAQEGSTPEIEAIIRRTVNTTCGFVILIYLLVGGAAFLGVAKPF